MRPIRLKFALFVSLVVVFSVAIYGICVWQEFVFLKPTIQQKYRALWISGHSMEPNFHNNDVIILKNINKNYKIKRWDVVSVTHTGFYWDKNLTMPEDFLKRVVGLPGEELMFNDGKIFARMSPGFFRKVSGNFNRLGCTKFFRIRLDKNQYFVLGDNRQFSLDSRYFGPIYDFQINGVEVFRTSNESLSNIIFNAIN